MSKERPQSAPENTAPGTVASTTQRTAGRLRIPDRLMPRSPNEALEPRRGPVRPRSLKERQPPKKLGPRMRAFNGFQTFLAVALAAMGIVVLSFEHEVDKAGPLKATKTIVVPDREGAQEIAKRLETDGVIGNAHVFVAHYLLRSLFSSGEKQRFVLKSGEYNFDPGTSIRDVTEAIGKGRAVTFNVTIPEGLTSWQIVERLKAEPSLSGEVTRVPAEGSLMPDTYRVPKGMARSAVLDMMRAEHQKFMERVWTQRAQNLPVRSPEEALILASIVEKETGRRDERQRVAAVFVNRLRKNMRLQSDPTILYGLAGGQVQWGKPITRADINSRTPHNTYVIAALPPSPICNPGRASITASLNPAATNEIYFVADGQGGHIFSETLKEHNNAVQNWRKAEKEIRARQAERQVQAQGQAAQQTQVLSAGQPATQSAQPVATVPAQVIAAETGEETPASSQPAAPPAKRTQRKN
jgi:UPF0755 protein